MNKCIVAFLALFLSALPIAITGFAVSQTGAHRQLRLCMAEDPDKLSRLGYTPEEIQRSQKEADPEPIKVQVNEVKDIDAVTLTAVGFGLIAANFFIFANMGDGGIAGVVASLINLSRQ